MNLASVPEARPIEDFWAILKREVYKGGWAAQSGEEFTERIKASRRKIKPELVQKLMGSTHKRLDQIRRYGLL